MEQPDLWAIETERFAQGIQTICGVDEAGAGPLAGRVYAGAVILPKGWTHPWLGDSKKVTEKRREVLYDLIRDEAVAWSIALGGGGGDRRPQYFERPDAWPCSGPLTACPFPRTWR